MFISDIVSQTVTQGTEGPDTDLRYIRGETLRQVMYNNNNAVIVGSYPVMGKKTQTDKTEKAVGQKSDYGLQLCLSIGQEAPLPW